jgi:hypothetical protein
MQTNPYSPPQSEVKDTDEPLARVYGGIGRVAYLLALAIFLFVAVAFWGAYLMV